MIRLLAAAILAATFPVHFAHADGPLDLVPDDVLICWKGEPFPDTASTQPGAAGEPSAIATLIDAGTRIAGAPLRARQKFALRLVEAFGAAARKPFALAILDAKARPTDDGDGKRVDKLQVALIVRTNGRNEPFLKIVQKAVNELTDQGQATLAKREAAKWKFDELTDKRLSESIAWGIIGDYFIVSYGPGVWPRIAAIAAGDAAALSRDAWVAEARTDLIQSLRSAGSGAQPIHEPIVEVYLAARAVRERIDPFVDGRASRFFAAMHAEDMDRALWSLGFKGRALYCAAHYRESGQMVRRLYADPDVNDPRVLRLIPADSRYAIYRLHLPSYTPRMFGSYYATRDEKDRDSAERFWQRIQQELGFDGQKDLLDHLGSTIVLHNHPPHPLRLPLAFTCIVDVRDGAKVRATMEKLLTAWQKHLADTEAADEAGWTALERDDDGVWYLQYGPIAGLAWTMTDHHLVTSWSPAALRDAVRLLEARPVGK